MSVDKCLEPLEAENKEDDHPLIVVYGKSPLIVGVENAMHYPNPPNPSKVLYISRKEAAVLRVERGVPVSFSIWVRHDVAFCITFDPIVGAASINETKLSTWVEKMPMGFLQIFSI